MVAFARQDDNRPRVAKAMNELDSFMDEWVERYELSPIEIAGILTAAQFKVHRDVYEEMFEELEGSDTEDNVEEN